ncbi:MAG: Spi family protease inhibitor, partial [Candidatus Marinimicrobia bacterium]|nr:Spi family protease inhibitor [Candidatus Neomarinimicrobiota bacterium]
MKKLFLLIIVVIVAFTIVISGKEVTKETASNVAKNWIKIIDSKAGDSNRIFKVDKIIKNENLYIVSFENGGFVIMPNNDDVSPILGYSLDSP